MDPNSYRINEIMECIELMHFVEENLFLVRFIISIFVHSYHIEKVIIDKIECSTQRRILVWSIYHTLVDVCDVGNWFD